MICQKCGIKTAIVHYTNTINGNKTEVHLCEDCAKLRENSLISGISDIMSGFFGIKLQPQQENSTVLKCDFCGSTQNDISKNGKAGCGNCYKIFGEYLTPIIRRVHGTDTHTGKRPLNFEKPAEPQEAEIKPADPIQDKLAELEEEMKCAIAAEDYERAAKIRDEIKKLK